MSANSGADDSVLPFDQSDVVGGVGPIEQIVDLSAHRDCDRVVDGRCRFCGYDRGDLSGHTEIAVRALTCRQCEAKLGEWE